MKKQLAIIAILATVGGFAKADDKGTEFKFGGEVRQSYFNNQAANLAGGSSGGATTTSMWLDRNMFHVNAISSDKVQAYFNFVHTAVWGGALGVPSNQQPVAGNPGGTQPNTPLAPGTGGATSVQNALQVSEAWLWWKLSDNTSLRSGRQSMDYGDGLVFSKNDWLGTPFNVDGIMARMSWDFMDIDFGGGVLADAGVVQPGGASTGFGTDAQIDFYGFYAQFKGLPDVIKKAELFVLQTNVDAGTAPNIFLPGFSGAGGNLGLTSIGLHAKGDFSMIDYRLDGVLQTGKQNAVGGQSVTFGGNMIDAEIGANFAEFMKARIFVNYHVDSGDNNTGGTRTSQNTYQPLFYDRHTYSGGMNMFGFGNLTNLRIGAAINPSEDTNIGLEVDMLSRTQTSIVPGGFSATNWLSPTEGNMYGSNCSALTGICAPAVAGQNGANSGLGTEFMAHASHNYGHGFSMLAQVGYLTLGNYFTSNGASTTNPWQFIGQAKYQF
jgi:hypothetical protein